MGTAAGKTGPKGHKSLFFNPQLLIQAVRELYKR